MELEEGGVGSPPWVPRAAKSNADVSPENWALSCAQLFQFVASCKSHPEWARIEAEKGYVSGYSVKTAFVMPWTRGTGASVSLNMNAEEPLGAKLMISHAWKEDIWEFREALGSFMQKADLPLETPVWFCLLALYQATKIETEKSGPTIGEQLKKDPFGCLIRTVPQHHGVLVVHTTRAEVYDRLWCVYEMAEAVRMKCKTRAAFSDAYVRSNSLSVLDVVTVHTKKAQCSVAGDRRYIWRKVLKVGGFRRLDARIFRFRLQALVDLFELKKGVIDAQKVEEEFEVAEQKLAQMERFIFRRRLGIGCLATIAVAVLISVAVVAALAVSSDDSAGGDVLTGILTTTSSSTSTSTVTSTTSSSIPNCLKDQGGRRLTATPPPLWECGATPGTTTSSTTSTTTDPVSRATRPWNEWRMNPITTSSSSTSTGTTTTAVESAADDSDAEEVVLIMGIIAAVLILLSCIACVVWRTFHHGFSASGEPAMSDLKQRLEEAKQAILEAQREEVVLSTGAAGQERPPAGGALEESGNSDIHGTTLHGDTPEPLQVAED